jgi:RNA polymerase sigma-70 factor (ECF subfamily)
MKTFDVLQVYDALHTPILRYVANRVGDVEIARDITAEVFFKMYKNRWKYKFTGAPISAWLYRIAGNEINTFYRKQKYKPLRLETALKDTGSLPLSLRGDLQQEISDAQEKVDQNTAFTRIHKQLRQLPGKYQDVIVMHYLEEQTIPQIAALLGKKEGTVKSLISRGIAKLRTEAQKSQNRSEEGLLVPKRPQEGVKVS